MSKKTIELVKETENDAVIQVKGNQPTLLQDCQSIAETTPPDDSYEESLDKHRNRLETRKVLLYFFPLLTYLCEWGGVKAVIKVERTRKEFKTRKKQWHETKEVSYYISTIDLSAKEFCYIIRNHWGIENRNHYVRDVTLGEDNSRIRINPHIFAKLRSFALNIMRKNGVENVNVALFDQCMDIQKVLDSIRI